MSSIMKKATDAVQTVGAKMGLTEEGKTKTSMSSSEKKKKEKEKQKEKQKLKGKEQPQQQPVQPVQPVQPTSSSTLSAKERLKATEERNIRMGYTGEDITSGKGKTLQGQPEPGIGETKLLPRNRGLVYMGEGKVELKEIPYPQMKFPWSDTPITNGVILKVLTSGICGSDLLPYRGHTTMQPGAVLGHEFCGEVVEAGPGVQLVKVGDWGCVPFNFACGCCDNCVRIRPECCEITNEKCEFSQGSYNCGGSWQGGQAEYVFVPFADFNFLPLHDKSVAKSKLLDLTLLSNILPTAMNGVVNSDVQLGSTVFIAGAGPVGLLAAQLSLLKGAAAVIIADHNTERLAQAKSIGCFTIDMTDIKDEKQVAPLVKDILGVSEVDCFIDCVGFEFHDASPLNIAAEILRPGAWLGVPGVYAMGAPKSLSSETKGMLPFNFAKLWIKGTSIRTGPTPVIRYNRGLMSMILHNRLEAAKLLNVKVVSLEDAPTAYKDFCDGAPHKFIIDPFNTLGLLTGTTTSTTSKLSTPQP